MNKGNRTKEVKNKQVSVNKDHYPKNVLIIYLRFYLRN